MFNPYAVRPIGSEQFLRHLVDCQVSSFYDYCEIPVDISLDLHGVVPWHGKEQNNCWTNLMMSIVSYAILEYLEYYEKKEDFYEKHDDKMYWVYNSFCITLENDYFRRNPSLEALFDKLLEEVCWEGTGEIRKCKSRIRNALRWTQKSATVKKG